MTDDRAPIASVETIEADLAESEADVAAGRTSPLAEVIDRMRARITRIKSAGAKRVDAGT